MYSQQRKHFMNNDPREYVKDEKPRKNEKPG